MSICMYYFMTGPGKTDWWCRLGGKVCHYSAGCLCHLVVRHASGRLGGNVCRYSAGCLCHLVVKHCLSQAGWQCVPLPSRLPLPLCGQALPFAGWVAMCAVTQQAASAARWSGIAFCRMGGNECRYPVGRLCRVVVGHCLLQAGWQRVPLPSRLSGQALPLADGWQRVPLPSRRPCAGWVAMSAVTQ